MRKPVFEKDLISGMQYNLAFKKEAMEKLPLAIDYIHNAMDIFESKGMHRQAMACERLLAKLAGQEDTLSDNELLDLEITDQSDADTSEDDSSFEDEK